MARGIWMDLLCAMHKNGHTGKISGMVEQLCRVSRCSIQEFTISLDELKNTKTADVVICNAIVTIINRRMEKESKEREFTRERVKKYRSKLDKKDKCNTDIQNCNAFYDSEDEDEVVNESVIKDEDKIKEIVTEFYNYQKSQFPDLVKVNDKKINEGIKIIDKLIRIDNFNIEGITEVLKFIVNDDFWSKQVLSLNGLRNKSKNGNTKFVNAFVKSKKSGESRVSVHNKAVIEDWLKEKESQNGI